MKMANVMKSKQQHQIPVARSDLTLGLLFSVCVIEGMDIQLLPASFKALERDLGLAPTHLAMLGMAQSIVQFVSGLVWGALADGGWSRKWMLTGGAVSWGCLTVLLAMVSSFPTMVGLRMMNGAALGILSPVAQSLIVDMTHPSERGFYFGWFQFAINFGLLISSIFTASISNMTIWGLQGWRVAFAVVAIASFMIAFLLAACMKEPERTNNNPVPASVAGEFRKCCRYLRIPTFKYIALQGAFGSIPWSALSFAILFFQNSGLTDFQASVTFSANIIGGGIGGVLGGWIGDRLSQWSQNHGRPLTAQISVVAGIPLIIGILCVVPREPSSFLTYFGLMLTFGLLASWCSAGVNRPILAEIVGRRDRSSVFAWLVALDGSFAAMMGAPMVGIFAENVFGYQSTRLSIAETPFALRDSNASALAQAMMCCTIGPWAVCFVFYSFLHLTYGPDVAACAALDDADMDAEKEKATATSALI